MRLLRRLLRDYGTHVPIVLASHDASMYDTYAPYSFHLRRLHSSPVGLLDSQGAELEGLLPDRALQSLREKESTT